MSNEMTDSLFCECDGKYQHVDTQEDKEAGTVEDSYQCGECKTWCITTWHRETDEIIERRYEPEEVEL